MARKARPSAMTVQEDIHNAGCVTPEPQVCAGQGTLIRRTWSRELSRHYDWVGGEIKGDREGDLLKLTGNAYTRRGLFEALGGDTRNDWDPNVMRPAVNSTIYGTVYDSRKRLKRENVEKIAQSLQLKARETDKLWNLMGWHNRVSQRKEFLEDKRKDYWFKGKNWEAISGLLVVSKGTLDNVKNDKHKIEYATVFRMMITMKEPEPRKVVEEYHRFGLHPLELGETDGIMKICRKAYNALDLQKQARFGNTIYEEHDLFWGSMWTLLDYYDGSRYKFRNAFFSRTGDLSEASDVSGALIRQWEKAEGGSKLGNQKK